MNNRIEELAKQCYIISGHPQIDGSYFDKEKFAELIVRECADWLSHREFASPDALKHHFGVE